MEERPIKRGNFYIYKNKLLGKGSFATTYLACSVVCPTDSYACKIIDKRQGGPANIVDQQQFRKYFILRLQEEVKAWKELEHPNIVRFEDIIESANSIYMMLEYCEQGDLERKLSKQLMLSPKEALQYSQELIGACTYLYHKGIIHRDIKPANLLLKQGHLKISDFGLAKILEKDELNTFKTGTVAGSPCYMAPQVLRQEKYGISCDVWSVGVLLYRMFIGSLPWQLLDKDVSPLKVLAVIEKNPLSLNKKLPDNLENLIRRMLEVDGRKRISMPEANEIIQQIEL